MNNIHVKFYMALLVALILTIMPLPSVLVACRPPWVLLLILYIQFYYPDLFKLSLVFLLGLVLDSLLATVIGEHAFSLCFVAWLANSKARRFSFFPMSQQMIFISLFAGVYQLTIVLLDSLLGNQGQMVTVLGGSVVSVLLWPWVRLFGEEWLLATFQRRVK